MYKISDKCRNFVQFKPTKALKHAKKIQDCILSEQTMNKNQICQLGK